MNAAARRLMGAYYTPADASGWMAQWLVSDKNQVVLEPSCGDGAFVEALLATSSGSTNPLQIIAVEKNSETATQLNFGPAVKIITSDFHSLKPFPVDAVIGNPPFVRLRHLDPGEAETAIRSGEQALGVRIDPSGSTWMTMVLHASKFLRPGGRLAFVLPADALYVRYAKPFWKYMAGQFGGLRLIRCRERIFPDILQDVVLILAESSGASTCEIRNELYGTVTDLVNNIDPESSSISVNAIAGKGKPFTEALLGPAGIKAARLIGRKVVRADKYVKFNIGYVAGDKKFFHPDEDVRTEYRLPSRSLLPTMKSGRQLGQTGLWTSGLPDGATSYLWLPNPLKLTKGEQRYIEEGERAGVDKRYKTRIRNQWYCVPGIRKPDVMVPVFGTLPKLIINDAGLVASNSLVSGFWRADVEPSRFALVWYSSITRLGIELSVHALGGGVLVVIPGEADAIHLPAIPDLKAPSELVAELELALLSGDTARAYEVGDHYLKEAGWGLGELESAKQMACVLHDWRVNR